MKLTRILCATLCVALCLAMFAACGRTDVEVPDNGGNSAVQGTNGGGETTAPVTDPTQPAVVLPSNYLNRKYQDIIFKGNDIRSTEILKISVIDTVKDAPADAYDVSDGGNRSVLAWITDDLELIIAGEGGVVAGSCKQTFAGYRKAEVIDLSCFYTNYSESFEEMFMGCQSVKALDLSHFVTNRVESMAYMFGNCGALVKLNISSFNTAKVENMRGMFNYCNSLTSLDLSHFTTENVKDMAYMFAFCWKLNDVNVSSFHTAKVKDMTYMFADCETMASVDLSSFTNEKVTSMSGMFASCDEITSIDVSNFNTSKVEDFSRMFENCAKLSDLNLSSFDLVTSGTNFDEMFYGCKALTSVGCELTLPRWCSREDMYTKSGLK